MESVVPDASQNVENLVAAQETSTISDESPPTSVKRKREDDDEEDLEAASGLSSSDDEDEDDDSIVVPDDEIVPKPQKLTEEEEEKLMKEEAEKIAADLKVRGSTRYPLRANIRKPTQQEYFEKLRLEAFLEDEKKERVYAMKSWWKLHKVLLASKLSENEVIATKSAAAISVFTIEDVRKLYYSHQKILVDAGLVEESEDEDDDEDEDDEEEDESSYDEDEDDEEEVEEDEEEDDDEEEEEQEDEESV